MVFMKLSTVYLVEAGSKMVDKIVNKEKYQEEYERERARRASMLPRERSDANMARLISRMQ